MQRKGDIDRAELQYRASVDMNRRMHGDDEDHPSIACSLRNLG